MLRASRNEHVQCGRKLVPAGNGGADIRPMCSANPIPRTLCSSPVGDMALLFTWTGFQGFWKGWGGSGISGSSLLPFIQADVTFSFHEGYEKRNKD